MSKLSLYAAALIFTSVESATWGVHIVLAIKCKQLGDSAPNYINSTVYLPDVQLKSPIKTNLYCVFGEKK